MTESSEPPGTIDPTQFRRAGIVAFLYALVDFLIILGGSFFLPLRLIGIAVAFFVIKDILVLREAGLEWGWTRYLVLIVVAVGGFLGFFFYAWRRHQHLQDHSWPDPAEDQVEETEDATEQEPEGVDSSSTENERPLDSDALEAGSLESEEPKEAEKTETGTEGS